MEHQGKVGIDGGLNPRAFDNEAAPTAPEDHLARFIEALAHHSAVCRKLHPEGVNPAAAGNRGKESG
jgi:hypothetical protein